MTDRRNTKIVITVISDGDNFTTSEKDSEAMTCVYSMPAPDNFTLYRILMALHKNMNTIEEEINASAGDD